MMKSFHNGDMRNWQNKMKSIHIHTIYEYMNIITKGYGKIKH